jgi:cytochrome c oxidase subunit 4
MVMSFYGLYFYDRSPCPAYCQAHIRGTVVAVSRNGTPANTCCLKMRIILASCRYDLDISLPPVLSYYLIFMEKTEKTKDHIISYRTYLYVLGILITLTLISVSVTSIYLGPLTVALALLIAVFKSSFVLRIFMHLKFESRLLTVLVILVASLVTSVIIITLLDYIFR